MVLPSFNRLFLWLIPSLLISASSILPGSLSLPLPAFAQLPTNSASKAEADRLLQQAIEEPYQPWSGGPGREADFPNYKVVIPLMDAALKLYREIKDRQGEVNALNHLGMIYAERGEMNANFHLGLIDSTQKDYQQAFDYYQQGLAIAREIKDQRGEIAILNSLGNMLLPMEEALSRYRDDDRTGRMNALNNLGIAYAFFGKYRWSLFYYQQGLAIAREIRDRRVENEILNNLRLLYKDREPVERQIEANISSSVQRCREARNRECEMAALWSGAWNYGGISNYPKRIEYAQQALAIAREINDRKIQELYLKTIAEDYSGLNDYPRAIYYLEQLLAISREISDFTSEAGSLEMLSGAYRALGKDANANEYSRLYKSLSRSPRAINASARQEQNELVKGTDLALLHSGEIAGTEKFLLDRIQWNESWAQKATSEDHKKLSYYYSNYYALKLYSNLEQVLITQNKIGPALEIAERGRAKAFVELLAKRLQSTKQLTIQPIQITAIKQVAREQNATLVEYFQINNEQLFIWVVQPSGAVAFRKVDLNPLTQQRTSLDQLVASARCLGGADCESKVASSRSGQGGVEGVYSPTQTDRLEFSTQKQSAQHTYLQQLHKLLIAPVTDLLPSDPNAHIIFMPQGSLFLVPFAALQDAQGKYLIEQHTIITAPSIQVLESTQKLRQQVQQAGRQQALVVGNPRMPLQLPQLPGAQKEAEAIAPLLHTQAIVGAQATKVAIVRQMPNARWIHLATHGILDDQGGLNSAIALAPNGTGETNDGLLTADEILNLKLNAELVVLSACDTGEGRITGDGVLGLSRSLITAGVPSVLVSLWAVNDDSTSQLMRQFYTNLSISKMGKAEALRQAQLTLLKGKPQNQSLDRSSVVFSAVQGEGKASMSHDLSAPYYWAPFILIGNGL